MRHARPGRERGVALLLVLWACTLLAILLGGYAALARTERLQARYQFTQAQAHYAAEAGVMRAMYGLHDPSGNARWVGDGRVYTFTFDHATVKVAVVNDDGKVDLNAAQPAVLEGLFRAAGTPEKQAQLIAANVVQWRSSLALAGDIDARRSAYAAAGLAYGPRNGPFESLQELQLVLGMTPALYRRIAPVITIWSGSPLPNPNDAPALALAALPGMTPQRAAEIAQARLNNAANAALVMNNGVTHSIRSEATLADGASAQLEATLRWQPGNNDAQPYRVLRWREGGQE